MYMSTEKQLEEQFAEFQELGKQNKDIDVASLMLNSFQNAEQNLVSAKQKRWAYLVSVGVPPFGLLFALKFFFSEEDDARQVAYICILLTIFSIVATAILIKTMFSTAGVSPQQIQQIKPDDYLQLVQ